MGRPKGSKNKKTIAALDAAYKHTYGIEPPTPVVSPEPTTRRRGRPFGSKNRPKEKGATISFLPPTSAIAENAPTEGTFSVKCQVSRLGLEMSALHPDHVIGKWEKYHTAMDVRNLVVNLCVEAVKIIREQAARK
jgi:hypothetical protein